MSAATAHRPAGRSRPIALLAVAGLHLLGLALIARSIGEPPRAEPSVAVTVWLTWKASARDDDLRAAPSRARATPPRSARTPAPATALTPAPAPAPAPAAEPAPTDWETTMRAAAAASLADSARERRRAAAMGTIPHSPYASAAPTPAPAFPWSRQPLGKHFDYDPHKGLLTLRTRHCVVAIWIIWPGFSCWPGADDPEPGQGDLFDRRYAVPQVELPKSLRDAQPSPP